jgi:hypothetical protein
MKKILGAQRRTKTRAIFTLNKTQTRRSRSY